MALLLSGCATGPIVGALPATGYQADGSYVATPEDERLSCNLLGERLKAIAVSMEGQVAQARSAAAAPPATLVLVMARMSGRPGDGTAFLDRYRRDETQAIALTKLARDKRCDIADAEKRLGEARGKLEAFRNGN